MWEEMLGAGITPSNAACHRMFDVWASTGSLDEAESLFGRMKHSSKQMRELGDSIADAWAPKPS